MAQVNKFYLFLTLCSGMAVGSTVVNRVSEDTSPHGLVVLTLFFDPRL